MYKVPKLSHNAGYNYRHYLLDRALNTEKKENKYQNVKKNNFLKEYESNIPTYDVKLSPVENPQPIHISPTDANFKELSLLSQIRQPRKLRNINITSSNPTENKPASLMENVSILDQIKKPPSLKPTTQNPRPVFKTESVSLMEELKKAHGTKFKGKSKSEPTMEDWGTGLKQKYKKSLLKQIQEAPNGRNVKNLWMN